MKSLTRLWSIRLMLSIAVCLLSCKKTIRTRSDMIAFIDNPDNGLQKSEQVGEIKAVLTYKPVQLMANNGRSVNNKIGSATPDYFKNKLFFVLSFSAHNKELLRQLPFNQYSEMVQVLAFRMVEFIDLVPDDQKPVQPLECLFQQTYGVSTANSLLIVFDKAKLTDASNLNIQIKEFGLNLGNLNFTIDTKNIKEIQNIAIN